MRVEIQRSAQILVIFLILYGILTIDFRSSKMIYIEESNEKITSEYLNISANSTSWIRTWSKFGEEYGNAIVIDSSNDIYVGGTTLDSSSGLRYLCLLKYNSSGDMIWEQIWRDERAEWMGCSTVANDSLDNIYLAGTMEIPPLNKQFMILLKYDKLGNKLWNISWGRYGLDICSDTAIDSSNNIYLVGYSFNQISGADLSLVKFNSSGTQLWNYSLASLSYDEGTTLAIDSNGNSYIGGLYKNEGILLKLNATGAIQWNFTFSSDFISDVAIDSSDNIIASGSGTLFKFNCSGSQLWNETIKRSTSKSFIIDSSDNIYMAQNRIVDCIDNSFFTEPLCYCTDIYIEQFNQEGDSLWEKRITGCSGKIVSDLALDSLEDLYMSGTVARNVLLIKNPEEYYGICFEFYWDLFLVIIIPSSIIIYIIIIYFFRKRRK